MTRLPDESAALRALRESLTEAGASHPAEYLLLAYADKHSTLAEDVAESIDAHLAECASCRDEVGVLGTTTIRPSSVMAVAEKGAALSGWQRIVGSLRGSMWRPALALAVLFVLMVPTLRRIGQDRATKHEARTPSVEQGREGTSAPAALTDAAPSSAPPPHVDDSLVDQRHMLAARESESRSRNAFAPQAMAKHRAIASPSVAPTFDYVPGGRVSIAPDVTERVMLRINFVRDVSRSTDMRSNGVPMAEASPGVVLAPTVSEVDVVVIAADGRRNSRRVQVAAAHEAPTSSMVDLPIDWLAAGENRVEIVSRDDQPRSVGASFVVTLQRPD